jgi:hypothetical protein
MDLVTFQQRLAQCGADLDRWSNAEAEAARALMANSAEARESFVQALSLEAPLAANDRDLSLVDRIMGGICDDAPSKNASSKDASSKDPQGED